MTRCPRPSARWLLVLASLVMLAPRAHAAREPDLAVLKTADSKYRDLETQACVDTTPAEQRPVLAAEHGRLAAIYDFTARNLPESLSTRERAGKLYYFATHAISAYLRAYDCVPGREHRDTLAATISLIDFAATHPGQDREAALAEYEDLRKQVAAREPTAPTPTDTCPRCKSCDGGPPPHEGRRGCAIDPTAPGVASLALLLLLRRRRRFTR